MPLLTETIISAAIISFFLVFLILIDKKIDYREGFAWARYWLMGVFLILGVTIANCIVENRWDYDYILEFLSLKEVGAWLFRILASLSYLLIIVGSVSLIAFNLKSIIKKEDDI